VLVDTEGIYINKIEKVIDEKEWPWLLELELLFWKTTYHPENIDFIKFKKYTNFIQGIFDYAPSEHADMLDTLSNKDTESYSDMIKINISYLKMAEEVRDNESVFKSFKLVNGKEDDFFQTMLTIAKEKIKEFSYNFLVKNGKSTLLKQKKWTINDNSNEIIREAARILKIQTTLVDFLLEADDILETPFNYFAYLGFCIIYAWIISS